MRRSAAAVVCLLAGLALPSRGARAAAPAQAAAPARASDTATPDGQRDPELARLLLALRAGGLLDNRQAALEEVEALLADAQSRYVRGDLIGSASLLLEITHSPRYANFRDMPILSSVHYHLGVALQAYGAHLGAARSYTAVLARGAQDTYFTPALRRYVDLVLADRDYDEGRARIVTALAPAGGAASLSAEDRAELDYLHGRARLARGDASGALDAFGRVGPRSRFYTAANYLAGTVHAAQKDFRQAEAAFCRVVGGPNQELAVYFVDRRYFPVRDLAQLGLGRIAHEELRHEDAFYHYFQVPEDSSYLPHALFEAAWTMAERGDHSVARGLIEELRERFPSSPQAAEARLLAALLQLYDCDFRQAEVAFTRFIDDMAPVADHIDEIRKDPGRLRGLHEEVVDLRAGRVRTGGDTTAHLLLLGLLDEDPTHARLSRRARALAREADFAAALDGVLAQALARLHEKDTVAGDDAQAQTLAALSEARELARALAGMEKVLREAEAAGARPEVLAAERKELDRLRARVQDLRSGAVQQLLAGPPVGSARTDDLQALLAQDRARIARQRAQALALAGRTEDQAVAALGARMGKLRARVENMLGEARMGRIDSVLGAKKKLEIEVRDMAAGKFPPELFGKLQIEGMVGDDEEFWPYEGEYWADEYEVPR